MFPEQEWLECRKRWTWLEKNRDREECRWLRKIIKIQGTAFRNFRTKFESLKGTWSRIDRKTSTHRGGMAKCPTRADLQTSNSTGPRKWKWWHVQNLLSPDRRNSRPQEYFSPWPFMSLLGVRCFLTLFGSQRSEGTAGGTEHHQHHRRNLIGDISVLSFLLSFSLFAVWAVLRLGSRCGERRKKGTKVFLS